MFRRDPGLLVLAFGLTLAACSVGGGPTPGASSTSPSSTQAVTAAPSPKARPSPTAVSAPTFPADVMDVADFSPLEL
jgi:hypothetical protein